MRDPRARDEQGRKRCSLCREWMPVSEFHKNATGADGLYPQCRWCKMCSQHGITGADYREMLEEQGSGCAICGNKEEILVIDHDHSCCPGFKSCGGCVRGLLCKLCNVALGQFKDDLTRMRSAVAYLERSV